MLYIKEKDGSITATKEYEMTEEILNIRSTEKQKEDIALAIGFFDGLHLGHRMLIEEVKKTDGCIPCVLTFTKDFKANLKHEKQELLLTKEEEREMLSSLGIEKEFILPFNEETKNTGKEEFLDFLKRLNPRLIVVGKDFTFAKVASGKATDLLSLKQEGIDVKLLSLLLEGNEKISSTMIKALLKEGKIQESDKLLGYDFYLEGIVTHGYENGRKIHFPTANMAYPEYKVRLKEGVYETTTEIDGKNYRSMTNIGNHPTIDALGKDIIETHVINHDEDLYGKEIKVSFKRYLRPQRKFASLDELSRQLLADKASILSHP